MPFLSNPIERPIGIGYGLVYTLYKKNRDAEIICSAQLLDQRMVTDSGGHRENRYVIETEALIGDISKRIELTLTDRDTMLFRMLLGRTALRGDFLVDAARSYLTGKHEI